MEFRFTDLVELEPFKKALDNIHAAVGVPYGLIDVQGPILAGSGWQEICLNFHQVAVETERRCRHTHELLRGKVWAGESAGYECPNGLMHYALPILVEGKLMAILSLGQISHHPLDLERFKAQARAMGFDEAAYLRALEKVPIIPEERFQAILALFRGLADLMAGEGLKRLRQTETARAEYLDLILQAVADAVVTVDRGGAVSLMNRAAAELLGQDPATAKGQPFSGLFQPRDSGSRRRLEDPLLRLRRGEAAAEPGGPALLVLPGSVERLVSFSGTLLPDGGAGFAFRDVTQEQRLQEDMQRTARLQSVGVLAGGIAHDFNNLLAAVAGNLSLARLQGTEAAQAAQCLADAEAATLRARGLTQQLMAFGKGGGKPRVQALALDTLVEEAARFALGGAPLRLEVEAEPGLWPVEADAGQIAQVVHNLVANAAHAMQGRGRLRVTLRNQEVLAGHAPVVWPGRYVAVSVRDQGPGLSQAALAHLFEPFYTTKAQGSGLGLASALGIIKAHHGDLRCESGEGKGACFTCWLPAATQADKAQAAPPAAPAAVGLRVLVVDDEPMLRDMLMRMLGSMGHQGQAAASGDEGLRAFRQAHALGRGFDLVISDLSMAPGQMGGKQLAREILAVDPKAKILASSGYSDDPVMSEHENFGFWGCLAKPFNRGDLERVLTMLIQQKA